MLLHTIAGTSDLRIRFEFRADSWVCLVCSPLIMVTAGDIVRIGLSRALGSIGAMV